MLISTAGRVSMLCNDAEDGGRHSLAGQRLLRREFISVQLSATADRRRSAPLAAVEVLPIL
jgi:hypothetical protein